MIASVRDGNDEVISLPPITNGENTKVFSHFDCLYFAVGYDLYNKKSVRFPNRCSKV